VSVSGGTIAYSIGQTIYSFESGSNGNVNQGVQQSYEIYTVKIDKNSNNISLKKLFLISKTVTNFSKGIIGLTSTGF
jgi:hypothetical protein